MKLKAIIQPLVLLAALSIGATVQADTTTGTTLLSEDFTGPTSTSDPNTGLGNWLFYNGACLTAGTGTALSAGFLNLSPIITPGSPVPSTIPGCNAVLANYYNVAPQSGSTSQKIADPYLVGGEKGYLGGSTAPTSVNRQQADSRGNGALRFTNGTDTGNVGKGENGAIVSTNAYPTSNGIQVTFKTVTYYGNKLGNGQTNNTTTGVTPNGNDGADGISFYLMDGCVPLQGAILPSTCSPGSNPIYNIPQLTQAIGAWGGSLAYSCSNGNNPSDGLVGGYLGLGIDEFGNFLNGSANTATPTFGTTTNLGDNTADGGGQYANRIGLRGAGSISWQALTSAYGTNPGDPTKPYYPATLSQFCSSSTTYNSATNNCDSCPTPTLTQGSGSTFQCGTVTTTTTYSCPPTSYSSFDSTKCISKTVATACGTGETYALPSSTHNLGVCTKTSTGATKNPTSTAATGTPNSVTTWANPATVAPSDIRQTAVKNTCSTGFLYNYSNPASPVQLTTKIMDYPAIPGGFNVLPAGTSIANENAKKRSDATVIYYNLKITSLGLLSLSYALSDSTRAGGVGAFQPVLTNKDITASNGAEPTYVRFGFAGSTGGGTNVHEILCFKSQAANQSASSAGVNEKQSAKVDSSTFAYFAYYDPDNWVGRVTANSLSASTDSAGVTTVSIGTTPDWDASCVLTGVAAGQTCSTGLKGPVSAPQTPAQRVIATWNGTQGVPFETSAGGITGGQLGTLDLGDNSTSNAYRLSYLRGDRTYEVTPAGTCSLPTGLTACFRARDSVLGDVIDSSPTWVGPPQSPYTGNWQDHRWPAATPVENSGQSYQTFTTNVQQRTNIVYVGANDGMLHGFRSGAFNNSGALDTTIAPNDGWEVFAYAPGAILQSAISGGGGCTGTTAAAATGSVVQNIHGVTPAVSSGPAACTTGALDFSNIQYGHNFFVDATPGTGDLYYGGAWHTWLVGGMGPGGAAIFALDVTDPATAIAGAGTPEAGAAGLVIGEWTGGAGAGSLTCVTSQPNCGNNLGNTYGTPIIRRLHDGKWGVIFGNGFGSSTGDAGIYVMIVNKDTGKPDNVYYLSTGTTGSANGIAYVTSADLDGDHITDYIYAGDLKGNIWRFDLTDQSESTWISTSPFKLFTTVAGQPITSALVVASGATGAGANTLMIDFGTGQKYPLTNLGGAGYPSGTQSLYGVWDWNLSTWNTNSTVQYAALSGSQTGLVSPYTIAMPSSTGTPAPLQVQATTLNASANGANSGAVTGASAAICWAGSTGCTTGGQFGWYLNLPGAGEQIVYNPQILGNVFQVNSVVPAVNSPTSCTVATDTGFTYAVSVLTGSVVPDFFIQYHDTTSVIGEQTNATGTSFPVTAANGSTWLIFQTVNNTPTSMQVNLAANNVGRRLTWVQLR